MQQVVSQSGICETATREVFSNNQILQSLISRTVFELHDLPSHYQNIEKAVK